MTVTVPQLGGKDAAKNVNLGGKIHGFPVFDLVNNLEIPGVLTIPNRTSLYLLLHNNRFFVRGFG